MAGNKKPRKPRGAYHRHLVNTRTRGGIFWPIPKAQLDECETSLWAAVTAIETGHAQGEHFNRISVHLYGAHLSALRLDDTCPERAGEAMAAITAGHKAMGEVLARHQRLGRFGFSGDERRAIAAAIDVSLEVMRVTDKREFMADALRCQAMHEMAAPVHLARAA